MCVCVCVSWFQLIFSHTNFWQVLVIWLLTGLTMLSEMCRLYTVDCGCRIGNYTEERAVTPFGWTALWLSYFTFRLLKMYRSFYRLSVPALHEMYLIQIPELICFRFSNLYSSSCGLCSMMRYDCDWRSELKAESSAPVLCKGACMNLVHIKQCFSVAKALYCNPQVVCTYTYGKRCRLEFHEEKMIAAYSAGDNHVA